MRGAVVLLSVGVLAGCMDAGEIKSEPAGLLLSAFEGCQLQYPDGAPVDCDRHVAAKATATPQGWVCVEQALGENIQIRQMSGPGGEVGIEYRLAEKFPDLVGVRFHVQTETFSETRFATGGRVGFTSLNGIPSEGSGKVELDVRYFSARGSVTFASNLTLKVTEYEDEPWYVYAFSDGARSYHFSSMGHSTGPTWDRWIPTPMTWQGEGWNLTVEALGWTYAGSQLRPFTRYPEPLGGLLPASTNCD